MHLVIIAVLTLVVVLTLAIWFGFLQVLYKKRRKSSSKYDKTTNVTETESLVGSELEISDVFPMKLSTIQRPYQKCVNGEEEVEEKSLHGYLYFTIKYDQTRSVLVVKLIKGENIQVHKSYQSKPHVEVFVIPSRTESTHGQDGIEFKIMREELFRQTVHFCICRYDKFSRKTTIGDIFLSLAELSADQEDLSNEIFMKNMIEPNIQLNIHQHRSAKDLWEKLRNATLSGKFIRQLKRQSFVEAVEWESALETADISLTDNNGNGGENKARIRQKSVKEKGPLGKLYVSLKFDEIRCVLLIRIMKAVNIPDDNGQPPCVMIEGALLSGTESAEEPFTTSVQENSFTPVFEEVFEFKVDFDDLWKKKIRFLVWYVDCDSQLTNLGEVVYSLSNLDIEGFNISETAMLFVKDIILLHKTKELPANNSSRLLFSLTYLPATKRLVVMVAKAKDLKATLDCRGVYVEVTILHTNLRYRKSTGFKTEKSNPVFNETLLFDLKDVIINNVKLQITVFLKNTMGSNIPLAKSILGKDVGGSEESHWMESLTAAKPTAQWHNLQPIKYVKPLVQGISTVRTKTLRPSFSFTKSQR